jgi:hypothetical protein
MQSTSPVAHSWETCKPTVSALSLPSCTLSPPSRTPPWPASPPPLRSFSTRPRLPVPSAQIRAGGGAGPAWRPPWRRGGAGAASATASAPPLPRPFSGGVRARCRPGGGSGRSELGAPVSATPSLAPRSGLLLFPRSPPPSSAQIQLELFTSVAPARAPPSIRAAAARRRARSSSTPSSCGGGDPTASSELRHPRLVRRWRRPDGELRAPARASPSSFPDRHLLPRAPPPARGSQLPRRDARREAHHRWSSFSFARQDPLHICVFCRCATATCWRQSYRLFLMTISVLEQSHTMLAIKYKHNKIDTYVLKK